MRERCNDGGGGGGGGSGGGDDDDDDYDDDERWWWYFVESGRYLALDLGGTNFRVLLVHLRGHEPPDVTSKLYLIPTRIMLGSGTKVAYDSMFNIEYKMFDFKY